MSAYGRRSSKTRRRRSPNHCFLERCRGERRLELLLSHGGSPPAWRAAEQRADALAIRGRRAERPGSPREHGVRNRAPCEQLAQRADSPSRSSRRRAAARGRRRRRRRAASSSLRISDVDRQARVDRLAADSARRAQRTGRPRVSTSAPVPQLPNGLSSATTTAPSASIAACIAGASTGAPASEHARPVERRSSGDRVGRVALASAA